MMPTRRTLLVGGLAAPALLRFGLGAAQAATVLKLSHQFPGGTIDEGDFRDRMCRKLAQAVGERSKGALEVQVYPGSSLIKTKAQFSARCGKARSTSVALSVALRRRRRSRRLNIGLMPGLVTSRTSRALKWKTAAGRQGKLTEIFSPTRASSWSDMGLAGRRRRQPLARDRGAPSRRQGPQGARRIARNGHGAADRPALPFCRYRQTKSYAAMQTGACDAGITSSTSLISFRLEEALQGISHRVPASGPTGSCCEPLMMSKAIFEQDAEEASGHPRSWR